MYKSCLPSCLLPVVLSCRFLWQQGFGQTLFFFQDRVHSRGRHKSGTVRCNKNNKNKVLVVEKAIDKPTDLDESEVASAIRQVFAEVRHAPLASCPSDARKNKHTAMMTYESTKLVRRTSRKHMKNREDIPGI